MKALASAGLLAARPAGSGCNGQPRLLVTSNLKRFSDFASAIHRLGRTAQVEAIASGGVDLLRESLGFDSAWYGWSRFETARTVVPVSSTLNLPDGYAAFWSTIEDQDLVARALRESRVSLETYDRRQRVQTDGMITLCDRYQLRRWASAMHRRPRSRTAFFVSIYRTDPRSPNWNPEELELLQCAVDHMSLAMEASANAGMAGGQTTFIVDADGHTYLADDEARGVLKGLWPGWRGDLLPPPLLACLRTPGPHALKDFGIVASLGGAAAPTRLARLHLKPLSTVERLSPREAEVARCLATGATYKQAAARLGSAPATVRNQTRAIYAKLGIGSRAQLAAALSTPA